jgi:hypothetical protein
MIDVCKQVANSTLAEVDQKCLQTGRTCRANLAAGEERIADVATAAGKLAHRHSAAKQHNPSDSAERQNVFSASRAASTRIQGAQRENVHGAPLSTSAVCVVCEPQNKNKNECVHKQNTNMNNRWEQGPRLAVKQGEWSTERQGIPQTHLQVAEFVAHDNAAQREPRISDSTATSRSLQTNHAYTRPHSHTPFMMGQSKGTSEPDELRLAEAQRLARDVSWQAWRATRMQSKNSQASGLTMQPAMVRMRTKRAANKNKNGPELCNTHPTYSNTANSKPRTSSERESRNVPVESVLPPNEDRDLHAGAKTTVETQKKRLPWTRLHQRTHFNLTKGHGQTADDWFAGESKLALSVVVSRDTIFACEWHGRNVRLEAKTTARYLSNSSTTTASEQRKAADQQGLSFDGPEKGSGAPGAPAPAAATATRAMPIATATAVANRAHNAKTFHKSINDLRSVQALHDEVDAVPEVPASRKGPPGRTEPRAGIRTTQIADLGSGARRTTQPIHAHRVVKATVRSELALLAPAAKNNNENVSHAERDGKQKARRDWSQRTARQ